LSEALSSWTRRRAAVAAEAEREDLEAVEAAQVREQEALAEKSDDEILQELGLPDLDSLGLGDDFKAFMSKSVPAHLRKRALRKLWRSNPVLACVDGLNDYDDDYLTQGLNQGVIKTSYQVGKGMLAHLLEVERLKDAASDAAKIEVAVEDDLSGIEPDVLDDETEEAVEDVDAEQTPAAPRRMQFQFEDDVA
jgi:hypothetical protein